MTDGSLGNVYDLTTNTYYNLIEDESTGEYKWENDKTPEKGEDSNLILLDCTLSDNVPEDMLNDYYITSAYNWTVYHPSVCTHVTLNATTNALYAGGYGTKLEPYEINDWSKMIDTYLNRDSYAYYKWTGAKEVNDNYNYYYRMLNGSFDGNGAMFTLIGGWPLFMKVLSSTTPTVIKNFNVLVDNIYDLSCSSGVVYRALNSIHFKNIEVSGTIAAYVNASSFLVASFADNLTYTIENCYSTADIINLYELSPRLMTSSGDYATGLAGFIGDASRNGNQTGITVILDNSSYIGNMYQLSTTSYAYDYVTAKSDKVTTIDEQYDDNVTDNNLNNLYTSAWQLDSTTVGKGYSISAVSIAKANITSTSTTVTAATNAETADFYYLGFCSIGGREIAIVIKDTQKVSNSGFISTDVHDGFSKYTLNQEGFKTTTISGTTVNLVDPENSKSSTSITPSAQAIVVLQRDHTGKILQINYNIIKQLAW